MISTDTKQAGTAGGKYNRSSVFFEDRLKIKRDITVCEMLSF